MFRLIRTMKETLRKLAVSLGVCAAVFGLAVSQSRAEAVELLMFEADYCEWCEVWNEEIGPIYPKTAESRCAPLRRLDVSDDLPPELDDVKPVRFTPTFVLLENGREVGRILGYAGEDFFWGLLAEQMDKLTTPCAG